MEKKDQAFLVQKIRTQYTETEHTQLDTLKALDRKVKRPANQFAYCFGILGTIIMGTGMSLVMTELGQYIGIADSLIPGIIIGIFGLAITVLNYPVYNKILSARKQAFAEEIITLSNALLEDEA